MTIGFIGLGIMGAPTARHLLQAGYTVIMASRSLRPVMDELRALGGILVDSPTDVAEKADLVFTCLGTPADVESVYLGGPETDQSASLVDALQAGSLAIDLTTSSPVLSQRIGEALGRRGVGFLDAPMTGGQPGAEAGRLTLLVGGATADLERVRPVLSVFATAIHHFGPAGAGSRAKVANQIAVASTLQGVAEALACGTAGGLDPHALLSSLQSGTADSYLMRVHGRKMVDGDWRPGFFVDHFVKDLGIALEEADRLGLDLPGLRAARECHLALAADGHGRDGIQVLLRRILAG